MIRVYAVVEGICEERFLRSIVAPHLAHWGVFLHSMRVLRGKGNRGGGSSWQPWRRHLRNLIAEHRQEKTRFTTMLDLYAVPKDAPGWSPGGGVMPPEIRAEALLTAMRAEFPDRRFLPYVQVHEFETLLFANLEALLEQAPEIVDTKAFAKLQSDVADLKPEAINDRPESAPSRRILAATRGFRKTLHGVQTVSAIGLPVLRQQCPRFDQWITSLEKLGDE